MECPGCHENRIPLHAKLRVAARRSVSCPACGATLRFQRLPRMVHAIVGDGLLLAGAAGSLLLQAPIWLLLSGGVWTILALSLPLSAHHEADDSGESQERPP